MGKWSNGVLGSSRSLEHTAAISLECNTEGGAASGQPNWFKSILISVYFSNWSGHRRSRCLVASFARYCRLNGVGQRLFGSPGVCSYTMLIAFTWTGRLWLLFPLAATLGILRFYSRPSLFAVSISVHPC
jgi:hypothetical protein